MTTLTYPSFKYSPEDQQTILERLQKDYAAYNISFVTEKPASDNCTSTLSFNGNDKSSITINIDAITRETLGTNILFGRSNGIDFRNNVKNDFAFVDANFWTFLAQFLTESSFSKLTGIAIEESTTLEQAVRIASINQVCLTSSLLRPDERRKPQQISFSFLAVRQHWGTRTWPQSWPPPCKS